MTQRTLDFFEFTTSAPVQAPVDRKSEKAKSRATVDVCKEYSKWNNSWTQSTHDMSMNQWVKEQATARGWTTSDILGVKTKVLARALKLSDENTSLSRTAAVEAARNDVKMMAETQTKGTATGKVERKRAMPRPSDDKTGVPAQEANADFEDADPRKSETLRHAKLQSAVMEFPNLELHFEEDVEVGDSDNEWLDPDENDLRLDEAIENYLSQDLYDLFEHLDEIEDDDLGVIDVENVEEKKAAPVPDVDLEEKTCTGAKRPLDNTSENLPAEKKAARDSVTGRTTRKSGAKHAVLQCRTSTLSRQALAHSWILVEDDGLYCKICKDAHKDKSIVARPWVTRPFVNGEQLARGIAEHEKATVHQESIVCVARQKNKAVVHSLHDQAEDELSIASSCMYKISHQALITAKCLVPHNTITTLVPHIVRVLQDEELRKWVEQDSQYLSPLYVRCMVIALGEVIHSQTMQEVASARVWSYAGDGTTDICGNHQFASLVRYVKDGRVVERMLNIASLNDGSAQGHMQRVRKDVEGLTAHHLVSVALDGASCMAGDTAGLQQIMRCELSTCALFVWCRAHLLNLASRDSAVTIAWVCKFFSVLRMLYAYLTSSATRTGVHDAVLKEMLDFLRKDDLRESTTVAESIPQACITRWLSFGSTANAVYDQLPALVTSTKELSESDLEAATIHDALREPTFWAMNALLVEVYRALNALSQVLQRADVTVFHAAAAVREKLAQLGSLITAPEHTKTYALWPKRFNVYRKELGYERPIAEKRMFDAFHNHTAIKYLECLVKFVGSRLPDMDLCEHFRIFYPEMWTNGKITPGFDYSKFMEAQDFGNNDICAIVDWWTTPKSLQYKKWELVQGTRIPVYSKNRYSLETNQTQAPIQASEMPIADVLDEWRSFRILVKEMSMNSFDWTEKRVLEYLWMSPSFPHLRLLCALGHTIFVSTSGVERLLSQLKLVKDSHRSRMKDDLLCAHLRIRTFDGDIRSMLPQIMKVWKTVIVRDVKTKGRFHHNIE